MALIKNGFLINTSKNVAGTIFYKHAGSQFSRSMPQYPEGWLGSEKQQLVQAALGAISHYIAERPGFGKWVNMNFNRRGRRYRGTGRDRLIGWTIRSISRDRLGHELGWDEFETNVNNMLLSENNVGLAVTRALPPTFSDWTKLQIEDSVVVDAGTSTTVVTGAITQQAVFSWMGQQRFFSDRSFSRSRIFLYVWGSTLQEGNTAPIYAIEMSTTTINGVRAFRGTGTFPGNFSSLPYCIGMGAELTTMVNTVTPLNTIVMGGFSKNKTII